MEIQSKHIYLVKIFSHQYPFHGQSISIFKISLINVVRYMVVFIGYLPAYTAFQIVGNIICVLYYLQLGSDR